MNTIPSPSRERTPEPRPKPDPKPTESKATNRLASLCLGAFALDVAMNGELLRHGDFYLPSIRNGEVWRVATSQLLHADLPHLLVNTRSLLSIGPSVEKMWGASSFLKIAALAGIIKVMAQSELDPFARSVGVSGVLYGMNGALHAVKIRNEGISKAVIKKIFFDLAKQTAYALALEAFSNVHINHVGHLSGYIAGFAFGWFSTLNKTQAAATPA